MNRNQMQALVDSMSEMGRIERSRYHVTLGKLINKLEGVTGNVRFADGGSPGEEMSYRGYYSDLSFEAQQVPVSAPDLLRKCRNALGATYEGYKGGDFVMSESTPLWRAPHGCCGDAIVKATVEGEDLVLHCLPVDD